MTPNAAPAQQSTSSLDLPTRLGLVAEQLKRISAALKQATKPGSGRRSKVIDLLGQAHGILAECGKLQKECDEAAAHYGDVTDREWSELDASIKELCNKHQWRLDGSWPSYMVAYGIQFQFDQTSKSVEVATTKYPGNDLPAIEQALAHQIARLVPTNFTPQDFLESLALAYDDARRSSPQAPILDVYKALVVRSQRPGFWKNVKNEKFVELTIEQFRARIAKTLEANVLKTKAGRELRFYPPLDPKDALFLYNPLERRLGFVGRIEFSGDAR